MQGLEIKEVGPEVLEDFLTFFENDAFPDNPFWASCFCNFYHAQESQDWQERTAAENKTDKAAAIRGRRATGLLAYLGGRPTGWVNAGLRSNFQSPRALLPAMTGGEEYGYVMCFVVSPENRGKGIASALLDAACNMFTRLGARYAEGYPSNREPQGPIPLSAHSYHGTRGMYERSGFEAISDYEGFTVMRKRLG